MPDIYRVTWPVTLDKSHTHRQAVRMADCADEETAEQLQKALVAIGYREAVVYGVTIQPDPRVAQVRRYAEMLTDSCFVPNREVARDFLDILDGKVA